MQLAVLSIIGFVMLWELLTRGGKRSGSSIGEKSKKRKQNVPRLSGVRAEVVEALRGQGFSAKQARRAAFSARGADFDSIFRDAIKRK